MIRLLTILTLVFIFFQNSHLSQAQYEAGYQGVYEAGYCTGAINVSGYVYLDSNQDNAFNAGEIGIDSQPMRLIQPPNSGTIITATTTNTNGYYIFNNVAAGDWQLHHQFQPAGNPYFSRTNPSVDSVFFTLSTCSWRQDFGIYGPYFEQNPPQPLGCNVRVSWGNTAIGAASYNIFWQDITTPGSGNFSAGAGTFFDITPSVSFVSAHQYTFLIQALNSSGTPIAYSDNQLWSHQIPNTTGYTTFPSCNTTLTGKVYADNDINNSFTAGDVPANGAIMQLISPVGSSTVYLSTTTNASGDYTITNIPPGNYDIKDNTALPGGYNWFNPASNKVTVNMSTNQTQDFNYINANPPIIEFYITKPPSPVKYPPDLGTIDANQNSDVKLNWSISNATSATRTTTFTDPSIWNTPLPLPGGISTGQITIPTTATGTFNFTLTVTNAAVPNNPPVVIRLRINKYPSPYIQTTGGDIHSNETIYITP